MVVNLFRTAGQFDMQVQPQLVLLQKTLLNIEGLGRQLYPALNLWDTAKPFLEQWVSERYSLQTVSKRLQEDAPALLESLPLLPDLVLAQLRQSKKQPVQVAATPRWVLPLTGLGALALGFGIAQSIEGLGWLILGGGCLLCAIVLRHR
jgi:ubiquinone biosynthesis protein